MVGGAGTSLSGAQGTVGHHPDSVVAAGRGTVRPGHGRQFSRPGMRVTSDARRTLTRYRLRQSGAERRRTDYSTNRRETLAVLYGLKQFGQSLLGRHFVSIGRLL